MQCAQVVLCHRNLGCLHIARAAGERAATMRNGKASLGGADPMKDPELAPLHDSA